MKYLKKIKVLFLVFATIFMVGFGSYEVKADEVEFTDEVKESLITGIESSSNSELKPYYYFMRLVNSSGDFKGYAITMSDSPIFLGYRVKTDTGYDFVKYSEDVDLVTSPLFWSYTDNYSVSLFALYSDNSTFSRNYDYSAGELDYMFCGSVIGSSYNIGLFTAESTSNGYICTGSDSVFFYPPIPDLPEIAQNLQMNQTLFQVVSLVPLLITLLAGYLALKKALIMLREILLMG